MNLNYKMVVIFIRSLANFLKSCKIEELWSFIGNQNESKYALNKIHQYCLRRKQDDEQLKIQKARLKQMIRMRQNQHKHGFKVMNAIIRQIQAKRLMQAFSFLNKYSISQKLLQTKVEISAEYKRTSIESNAMEDLKQNNVKILNLLKDSVSFQDFLWYFCRQ